MTEITRRSFIKTVIVGSTTFSVCPFESWAETKQRPKLASERSDICHQVRDERAPLPAKVARAYEVVIVGGGPSGLAAAYALRDVNFLLLEKEPRTGGNCTREAREGVSFSTGAAFTEKPAGLAGKYSSELELPLAPIADHDAAIINGKVVLDFWGAGLERLPYPPSVQQSFRLFLNEMRKIDLRRNKAKLDAFSFAELLKPYAPEVKQFWDAFGPSNWGGDAENTSAYVGVEATQPAFEEDRYSFPGGLGAATEIAEARVELAGKGRIQRNATVYRIEPRRTHVEVSYLENNRSPMTVAGKVVIVALPKFFARHIVIDLPEAQKKAMAEIRYAPYLVINLCLRKTPYQAAYDTWVPGKTFCDFIVADWVIYRGKGDPNRRTAFTVYVPLAEKQRGVILDDAGTLAIADKVVDEFEEIFPGITRDMEEVRIYRRGHPLFVSAPRVHTQIQPKAAAPFGRILFANTDSVATVSSFASASAVGLERAREAKNILARGLRRSRQLVPARV